eukprot:TRINITY_DN6857_c0_g1_i4.p1 TRINITY_DN6857_c0_g1~~TRINITY_DN6857_c0_g1_i4.p1  ORF type:complete len:160 (+),score=39.89 TRINITY_DN6857_c0_g1_i4:270-749(+)
MRDHGIGEHGTGGFSTGEYGMVGEYGMGEYGYDEYGMREHAVGGEYSVAEYGLGERGEWGGDDEIVVRDHGLSRRDPLDHYIQEYGAREWDLELGEYGVEEFATQEETSTRRADVSKSHDYSASGSMPSWFSQERQADSELYEHDPEFKIDNEDDNGQG